MSFPQANFTQVPNVLFDDIMQFLSGSELKILLLIIRKTRGFHKDVDYISLTQLEKFTGLKRSIITSSIEKLISKGVVSKYTIGKIGIQKNYYKIVVEGDIDSCNFPLDEEQENDDESNTENEIIPTSPILGRVLKKDGSENETGTGPKKGRGGVLKKDPQNKQSKETDKEMSCSVDVPCSVPLSIFKINSKKQKIQHSLEKIFSQSIANRENWTTEEIQEAWEILVHYKDPINDSYKMIAGTINNLRIKRKKSESPKVSNLQKKPSSSWDDVPIATGPKTNLLEEINKRNAEKRSKS